MDDELDPVLRRAAHALRQPVPHDPGARERILAAVRADAGARRGAVARAWAWLRTPRRITVTPLSGLALAASVAGAVALAGALRPAPATPPAMEARAEAPRSMVQFVLVAEGARSVSLAGDFNDWDPGATPLAPAGRGGVWSVVVPLPPGPHTYSFVVDGRTWVGDPAASPAPADDFGRPSSVILVREART